jgi:hypothetical protein
MGMLVLSWERQGNRRVDVRRTTFVRRDDTIVNERLGRDLVKIETKSDCD